MLCYCTPVTLAGHTVTLEPLTLDHAPDLLQALNNDRVYGIFRMRPSTTLVRVSL